MKSTSASWLTSDNCGENSERAGACSKCALFMRGSVIGEAKSISGSNGHVVGLVFRGEMDCGLASGGVVKMLASRTVLRRCDLP